LLDQIAGRLIMLRKAFAIRGESPDPSPTSVPA
jgi:hypothetical protein